MGVEITTCLPKLRAPVEPVVEPSIETFVESICVGTVAFQARFPKDTQYFVNRGTEHRREDIVHFAFAVARGSVTTCGFSVLEAQVEAVVEYGSFRAVDDGYEIVNGNGRGTDTRPSAATAAEATPIARARRSAEISSLNCILGGIPGY